MSPAFPYRVDSRVKKHQWKFQNLKRQRTRDTGRMGKKDFQIQCILFNQIHRRSKIKIKRNCQIRQGSAGGIF